LLDEFFAEDWLDEGENFETVSLSAEDASGSLCDSTILSAFEVFRFWESGFDLRAGIGI
jgi:hypothetical protein